MTATQTQRIEALEGPISSLEILEAERGFAEPPWFPAALAQLGTGVLFLTGAPRTGRRTAALNLLRRHTGGGLNFRAVDGSTDLDLWQPKNKGTLGYLVDGLVPTQPLKPAVLGNLRDRLRTERASMVIILPDDPELLRRVERDLHLTPVRCEPPPPRAVFDARLEAEIPDAGQRAAFLERLEPGLVDELLAPELVPAEVAELVALLTGPDQEGEDIRSRLSFLAEDEAPELIDTLRDDPDGLAFLMAACVFEGLDHRVVREEADRLLEVADGQLAALLPATEGSSEVPRDNPRFVFRRSLDDLLRTVRAQCAPKEIRTASGFTYAVEPVRFTRHRKAETVLRHVWREYGRLSVVLTAWLEGVKDDSELATPAGHVMGLAAGWGGGRRALGHISTLAGSDTGTGRRIAAHALGMAADDPVLATEVKYRLTDWSRRAGWQRRTTVAHACGTRFGLARPDLALSLLRGLPRSPQSDEEERHVNRAIRAALAELFTEDTRPMVFRCVLGWADADPEWEADLAFAVLPSLLHGGEWFGEELLGEGEFSAPIVDLVRRALDRDASFGPTGGALLSWCREGTWNERRAQAVTTLFDHLARDMRHGTLRLFVEIDRHSAPDLAGRDTARRALNAWRAGASSPAPEGTPR
ncbi:hypothetical protein IAG44_08360 [Streptomyces roseirectus]|uniref:Uncharacterized protein n=1 Tax=Streptomyces roseirectus TaxID=2768066 RepID=A0A7H0IS88_9ACTN|nr:hypothetical protein IAG44_08360 [Streptomyces roseirectus]